MTAVLIGVRSIAALLALLVPGYALWRRLPCAGRWIAIPLGSCAIISTIVLLLQVSGIPITGVTMAAALAAITGALLLRSTSPSLPDEKSPSRARGQVWWWLAVPGLLSVAVMAWVDPLSGYDNAFRWDYLARLLLAQHSLDGYPPITAHDFEVYGWCDGIPPLIPILNAWIYQLSGSVAPVVTAVRVVGEMALIVVGVDRLGRLVWRDSAGGATAVAVAAASSLLLWSAAIGQETGLAAAATVGAVYFLLLYRESPSVGVVFWAGVAAGVAALCREYGAIWAPFGFVVLVILRAPIRHVAIFALTATIIGAPWYLRNWVITGNPVYPHFGALFPTNPVHVAYMRCTVRVWNFHSAYYSARTLPMVVALATGVGLVFGIVGAVRAGKRGWIIDAAAVIMSLIWLWTARQTAAGWVVSLRVLAPTAAMLAALSGWVGQQPRAARVALACVIAVGGLDAGLRIWRYPLEPATSTLRSPIAAWRAREAAVKRFDQPQLWKLLVGAAGGGAIVVDHPRHLVHVIAAGGHGLPIFSSTLTPAFETGRTFAETIAELKRRHIRFILQNANDDVTTELAKEYPFWRELQSRTPVAEPNGLRIYDLEYL